MKSPQLYLSLIKPKAGQSADGVFTLTLQAYDHQVPRFVQPWRLIFSGPSAKAFWAGQGHHLLPGAVLEAEVTHLRVLSTKGKNSTPEIVAQVISLHLPVIAANPTHASRAYRPAPEPIRCSADARQ